MEFDSISSSTQLDQDTVSSMLDEVVEPQPRAPESKGQELLYSLGEPIFAAVAPSMVELGWSVYPQTAERRPGVVYGAAINWSKEHDLVNRLPVPDALRQWCSFCPGDNVALVPGPASGDVFAIDIDVMDAPMSYAIAGIADEILGVTPFRREGRAPKLVLLYRQPAGPENRIASVSRFFEQRPQDLVAMTTRDGQPLLNEDGTPVMEPLHGPHALEILSDGRSVTIAGKHHQRGSYFKWLNAARSPAFCGPEAAPLVTPEKLADFMTAVGERYAFRAPQAVSYGPSGSLDVGGLRLPRRVSSAVVRGAGDRVVDGRWTYMSSVAWHAVLAAREEVLETNARGAAPLLAVKARLLAQIVAGFRATAECRGRWDGESLTNEARGALDGAIKSAVSGKMKGGSKAATWVADPRAADPDWNPDEATVGETVTMAGDDEADVRYADQITPEEAEEARKNVRAEQVERVRANGAASTAEFNAAWDAKAAMERIAGLSAERRAAQENSKPDPAEIAAAAQRDASKARRAALPRITVVAGEIERMVDETEAALLASGRGLYQRGGSIVALGRTDFRTTDGLVSVPVIRPLGDDALYEEISSAAVFTTWDAQKERSAVVNPPKQVVKTYLDRKGRWKLPVLDAVITAPTLRADGSILSAPGYDQQTGLFYDPMGVEFPEVPDQPTREDAERALNILTDSVATFPFVKPVDRSVMLAAELTAPVRRNFPRVPAFVISAHTAGTGKTMLANIVGVIATGNGAALVSQGRSEEESEKILGGVLLKGAPVICIDNCDRDIGGSFLELLLTTEQAEIRPLGTSELRTVSTNALLIATGNNAVVSKDMTRRVMLCSLDAGVERPETRVFETDAVEEAKRLRSSLVWAALTVLRAFHVAGRPRQAPPLGSFTAWSGWVRDALVWLGEADACLSIEAARCQWRVHPPQIGRSNFPQFGAAAAHL